MSKKKRLPPGGKKLNYTLYISPENKKAISDRAAELEWAESYYVVTMCEIDIQLGLAEHLMSGGLIQLVPKGQEPVQTSVAQEPTAEKRQPVKPGEMPVPPLVTAVEKDIVQQEFKDSIAKSKQQAAPPTETELNPGTVQPSQPVMVRPQMFSVQDLVQASKGSPIGEVPGQYVAPDMNRAHQAIEQDQRGTSETAFRKKILDNLEPLKEDE